MTTDFKGQGDPRRVLALLWRTRTESTRGPRPSMSVEQIIAAAIAIADADGLAAVTMRRVAEKLGVGAMSLYTYVPSKAELLDLMRDEVYAEALGATLQAADWREKLEAHARADWDLIRRHPWTLQISEVRAIYGPNELALYDTALASIADVGLSSREMTWVVGSVSSLVRGAAQFAVDADRVSEQSGVSDLEWWRSVEPEMDRYLDPERYPSITQVAEDGAFDLSDSELEYHLQLAIDNFEFGLQRVLDGIAAYIERKRG